MADRRVHTRVSGTQSDLFGATDRQREQHTAALPSALPSTLPSVRNVPALSQLSPGHAGGPPEQLLLDLAPSAEERPESTFYVSESNRLAVDVLTNRARWPRRAVLLVGPPMSGKSMLLQAQAPGAVWLNASDCAQGLPPRNVFQHGETVVFDDIDRAFALAADERGPSPLEGALFHLLNRVATHGGHLLLSSRSHPWHWRVQMTDLLSRLDGLPIAEIEPPDDDLVEALLFQRWAEHGVRISPKVVIYMARRLDRDARLIVEAVDRVNDYALRHNRAVTAPLVLQALGWPASVS